MSFLMDIEQQCEDTAQDCLKRIGELRVTLDHIERTVRRHEGILNDLGEIQGDTVILDCRLAGLAVMRTIRDKIREREA